MKPMNCPSANLLLLMFRLQQALGHELQHLAQHVDVGPLLGQFGHGPPQLGGKPLRSGWSYTTSWDVTSTFLHDGVSEGQYEPPNLIRPSSEPFRPRTGITVMDSDVRSRDPGVMQRGGAAARA